MLLHVNLIRARTHLDSSVHVKVEQRGAVIAAVPLEEGVQLAQVLQLGVAVEQQRGVIGGCPPLQQTGSSIPNGLKLLQAGGDAAGGSKLKDLPAAGLHASDSTLLCELCLPNSEGGS